MSHSSQLRSETQSTLTNLNFEVKPNYTYYNMHPEFEDLQEAVLSGLSQTQKELPCWMLYDKRGSELFEDICDLEEYYPTRTELAIMPYMLEELKHLYSAPVDIIELGGGAGVKTQKLLESLPEIQNYICLEISDSALSASCQKLGESFPEINVKGICADYNSLQQLPWRDICPSPKRLVFFPGSTIGNFSREEAAQFLEKVHSILNPGDAFLLGIDLIKNEETLYKAYNDSKGVTADFNLNILHRIKKELNVEGLNVDNFFHEAVFNKERSRMEMHLFSKVDQTIEIAGKKIEFKKGESIHTENSHKFKGTDFDALMESIGFNVLKTWSDGRDYFNIKLYQVK